MYAWLPAQLRRPLRLLPVRPLELLLGAAVDYILEHPELPWLATEQEKVGCFELMGIDRNRIPRRT